GIFNGGVFPDFAYWTKSAEPLIMTILGGMGSFWGPAVGAAAFTLLNQQITSYTQYWPFTMGAVLIVLLFLFPGGIAGTIAGALARIRTRLEGGGPSPELGRVVVGVTVNTQACRGFVRAGPNTPPPAAGRARRRDRP